MHADREFVGTRYTYATVHVSLSPSVILPISHSRTAKKEGRITRVDGQKYTHPLALVPASTLGPQPPSPAARKEEKEKTQSQATSHRVSAKAFVAVERVRYLTADLDFSCMMGSYDGSCPLSALSFVCLLTVNRISCRISRQCVEYVVELVLFGTS